MGRACHEDEKFRQQFGGGNLRETAQLEDLSEDGKISNQLHGLQTFLRS